MNYVNVFLFRYAYFWYANPLIPDVMKKYLTLAIALFAAVALQSCKDDNTDEPTPAPVPNPNPLWNTMWIPSLPFVKESTSETHS